MPAYNRQLKDQDDNIIYPIINGDSLPDDSITTNKIVNGAVTANKIDFTTLPGNYSSSEIDTGYTWIDGKHIYKKTVYCGSLPTTNAEKQTQHEISNMKMCIAITGIAYNSTSGVTLPLPEPANNINYMITLAVSQSYIGIQCNADRSSYDNVYVTLYYIKTS